MAQQKKMVEEITSMEEDFAKWYTDIVKKAELIEYTSVKGCMVIRPYGYAIWENMQRILDGMFKATGHENVCMPMFIPESLLQKEKDHVEGFAPEVAWVTQGGTEKLEERLCVRPTSETLFCEHYANIIQSHRDLPKNGHTKITRQAAKHPQRQGAQYPIQPKPQRHPRAAYIIPYMGSNKGPVHLILRINRPGSGDQPAAQPATVYPLYVKGKKRKDHPCSFYVFAPGSSSISRLISSSLAAIARSVISRS